MKKNNKGFTLVELIAVIALLGILAMFAIPRIYSLITDSKKNVYIEDAIRLITQAQYAMNSKSVKIDKPDAGECIVISMKYLNSGDFQNPPNGGSYLPESSFVIVKNSGGDYVYSAMLVERLKDGSLMGVELSTESALNAKNALKHVRVFRDDEIAFINEDGGIDAGFINETIHRGDDEDDDDDYVEDDDKIIGFYNEEHEDEEIVIDTSIPKFTAKFSSSGTLQTTLSISASDADNSKDELKVCLKISDNSNDTYPDPTVQADVDDYCESYGTGAFYTKYIDFSLAENGSFTYESRRSAYVYIAVFDPNNNVVRKKMTYDIHENEPPVISLFTINHHPDDNHNMPRSRFILSLSDDMDNQENLQICFLQDDLYGTCADVDFKPYSYFFGPTNIYDYTFKDSNGMGITYPDGSHHNVTVFVKDSMGEMVRATAYYNIYQNAVPTITMNSIVPECLFKKADGSCNCNNCNSLTFTINMTITDDITPAEDVRITFYEKDANGNRIGEISMTYGQYLSGNKKYTFGGVYDGKKRVLYVDAVDEYGAIASTFEYSPNVYRDQPPSVVARKDANGNDIPFIQSAGDPCSGADTCTNRNNGGSYDAILTFDAVDDLATVSGIKVCLSEDPNVCKEANLNTSNFINYSEMNPQFSFNYTGDDPSQPYPNNPQITKKLYIALADDQGHVREYSDGWNYKLYKNFGPVRTGGYSIQSTDSDPHRFIMTVRFNLDDLQFIDDFDNYQTRLCYTIKYLNGTEEKVCDPYYSFAELKNALSDSYEFKDSHGNPLRYNVNIISTKIEAIDNYQNTAETDVVTYIPSKDDSPVILDANVSSIAEQYNSYIVSVGFEVKDPFDTYMVCLTTGDTCTDEQYQVNSDGYPFEGGNSDTTAAHYTITVDGSEKFGWPTNYQDNQGERSFNLIVKDSYGKIDKKTLKYTLYQLCSDNSSENLIPTLDDVTIVYDNDATEGAEISTSYCRGECYHNYKTTTNTNHVNYLTRTNDLFGHYKKTIHYLDNHVNLTCPIVSDEILYCDSSACFDTFVDGGASENPNLISLELKEENLEWYYTNERVERRVPVDKPYCRNIDSETSFFYPHDYRCTTPNFCGGKATAYCNPIVEAAVAENNAAKQAIDEEYARLEAIYAFEEEEALQQYLLAFYTKEYAPPEEPTDTPSPSDTGEIPEECVKNPAICECLVDMESHDDCPFILSCLDSENPNPSNACSCVLDPQSEMCSCVNDPTGDGCPCLLEPDGFVCGCENDPDGEFCQCLDDPEADGCEDFELPEPSPDPSPDPTPDPSPDPTPDPSPDPTPEPSPSDEPDPDPPVGDGYPDGFDIITAINVCSGITFHMNDSAWKTATFARCAPYYDCAACVGSSSESCTSAYGQVDDIGLCDNYLQNPVRDAAACSSFYSNDSIKYHVDDNDIGICDLLDTYISENRETFINHYEQSYPYPQKPPYPTFSEEELRASCETEYKNRCTPFYSFCNNTYTGDYKGSYKKVVSCSENPDITPIYCRVGATEVEDGLCLESDNSCLITVDGVQILDEEHCHEVCYKNYNCQEEYEIKPVVFTCHGYFETYRSSLFQGNIKLEKQENIICPDFYRLYPQFFAYNNESTTPFIKFNPEEVGGQ